MRTPDANRSCLLFLALCLSAACLSASSAALAQQQQPEDPNDLIIVCNKAIKDTIALSTVRDLFLRKRNAWPSGVSAVPINAPKGSRLRHEFQRRVLEMSDKAESDYWEKEKIMRAHTPPPEFATTLRAVFRLGGGISYVLRSQYTEGVSRVLFTLPADAQAKKGETP